VGPCGGSGGSAKDMDLTGVSCIVKVGIRHGATIDALSVCYAREGTIECTDVWGGDGGDLTEVLAPLLIDGFSLSSVPSLFSLFIS
jgi:hypothetical protein